MCCPVINTKSPKTADQLYKNDTDSVLPCTLSAFGTVKEFYGKATTFYSCTSVWKSDVSSGREQGRN